MKKNAAHSLGVYCQATLLNLNDYKCYHNLASALVKEDKLDEATVIYLRAIELYANCSWLHHYLGNVLQKQGKLAEAVSAYQQAIELYPNFSWSHNNLGNALEKQGKLEEGIAAYRRAIDLYPNFYLFHTNLDKALQKLSHLSVFPSKSYSKFISPFANLDNLRLAIVSTPRSGNTWLRKLLASMYDLPQIAVHTPREIAWQSLPPKVILQIHWRDTDNFVSLLAENGFRPIVIARHPLDVLISILHFASYESQTARWLDGEAGSEISIINNKSPLSSEFIDYAVGKRSAALLSISTAWWNRENTWQIRYENLVADTAEELSKLNEQLELKPARPILDVIPLYSLASLRTTAANNHFWQGKCGNWKHLLTAAVSRRIAISHQSVLNQLGYVCDPDEKLTEEMASTTWNALAVSAANS
ncbi:tetratricopeptide repeat protein [Microcoleus sp. A2-C5]|uniref:tetratricopeptide repeat protein n=1 Tax=unclassified Microcoleus TaxID=2642155 RepID=UPI002FD66D08